MSTLTVALVQTDIAWLDPEANYQQINGLLENVAGAELIVLPETFATGFAINLDCAEAVHGASLQFLQTLAARHQAVVAGSVLVQQGDKKANRFYWCWPDGRVEYYDKRHLFCLGKEGDFVVAGQQRSVFTLNGFRILPQVCYDLRFPVFQRNRNDYDVMVNVANWPAARRRIWDTLLQARAIENQCYVLACNRVGADGNGVAHNGGTAAYNYVAEPMAQVSDDTAGVVMATLDKAPLEAFRHRFPAHLDADPFTLG
ncbi:amidohydrolase [Pseudoalteromonas fenneropenaei]|uniref:Amidohydrolase n=1 Tax=Pseudoalteromonas fenneropenaei TaxID=1737459 RepID=A0ABV7CMB7_9GAMM